MRSLLHITFLPFLAIALMVGNQSGLCDAASVFGMDAHHHQGETSTCLGGHDHESEERVPCSENCESNLTEAPNPELVKTPQPAVSGFLYLVFDPSVILKSSKSFSSIKTTHEPPDHLADSASPHVIGRFLI